MTPASERYTTRVLSLRNGMAKAIGRGERRKADERGTRSAASPTSKRGLVSKRMPPAPSTVVYICLLSQYRQAKVKTTQRPQTQVSRTRGRRRRRKSQHAEGTMTNKPSQPVCRAVPRIALEMAAARSQAVVREGTREPIARRQRERQRTIAKRPGVSDMKVEDRGRRSGERTRGRGAKEATVV